MANNIKDFIIQSLMKSRFEQSNNLPDKIATDRLILEKFFSTDFLSNAYTLYLNDDKQAIGEVIVMIDGELCYQIYEESDMKQGYMTEALKAIIANYNNNVICTINNDNIASIKTAERLGFSLKSSDKIASTYVKKYKKKN
jgi:RimJ/RimL family protein N-acetyltransferase